ncbi:hypothetical protein OPT61_g8129 [Boeremia exigua]|uniref:Uncharacterized protein n=1 Tax=Boeremia exigua TaxID=749465 RepID=A0ACC2I166_9PLEO|nr:hypothetical protein OPT61_g8129 [Boeremia exigua]
MSATDILSGLKSENIAEHNLLNDTKDLLDRMVSQCLDRSDEIHKLEEQMDLKAENQALRKVNEALRMDIQCLHHKAIMQESAHQDQQRHRPTELSEDQKQRLLRCINGEIRAYNRLYKGIKTETSANQEQIGKHFHTPRPLHEAELRMRMLQQSLDALVKMLEDTTQEDEEVQLAVTRWHQVNHYLEEEKKLNTQTWNGRISLELYRLNRERDDIRERIQTLRRLAEMLCLDVSKLESYHDTEPTD